MVCREQDLGFFDLGKGHSGVQTFVILNCYVI
jgi:hypothetical protein